MKSIFGWSLPPGCGRLPGEEPEGPCLVCGFFEDKCICPECPECGTHGDPFCYEKHGLVRSETQIANRKRVDEEIAKDKAAEAAFWENYKDEYEQL